MLCHCTSVRRLGPGLIWCFLEPVVEFCRHVYGPAGLSARPRHNRSMAPATVLSRRLWRRDGDAYATVTGTPWRRPNTITKRRFGMRPAAASAMGASGSLGGWRRCGCRGRCTWGRFRQSEVVSARRRGDRRCRTITRPSKRGTATWQCRALCAGRGRVEIVKFTC